MDGINKHLDNIKSGLSRRDVVPCVDLGGDVDAALAELNFHVLPDARRVLGPDASSIYVRKSDDQFPEVTLVVDQFGDSYMLRASSEPFAEAATVYPVKGIKKDDIARWTEDYLNFIRVY